MSYIAVKRNRDNLILVPHARWCDSFLCKLRGLTFRRHLGMRDALVLVESTDSASASAIHMLFVFFPIAAIWINSAGEIVDCKLARPFRPFYAPCKPARYVLEGPPELLEVFALGDEIQFEPVAD